MSGERFPTVIERPGSTSNIKAARLNSCGQPLRYPPGGESDPTKLPMPETDLVAALVQIDTAIEMFTKDGSGHRVLICPALGDKCVPGVKAALRRQGRRSAIPVAVTHRRGETIVG